MTNSVDEAYAILNGKYGLKYAGKQLEAMRSIAEAYNKKSLRSFQNVLQQYQKGIFIFLNYKKYYFFYYKRNHSWSNNQITY